MNATATWTTRLLHVCSARRITLSAFWCIPKARGTSKIDEQSQSHVTPPHIIRWPIPCSRPTQIVQHLSDFNCHKSPNESVSDYLVQIRKPSLCIPGRRRLRSATYSDLHFNAGPTLQSGNPFHRQFSSQYHTQWTVKIKKQTQNGLFCRAYYTSRVRGNPHHKNSKIRFFSELNWVFRPLDCYTRRKATAAIAAASDRTASQPGFDLAHQHRSLNHSILITVYRVLILLGSSVLGGLRCSCGRTTSHIVDESQLSTVHCPVEKFDDGQTVRDIWRTLPQWLNHTSRLV